MSEAETTDITSKVESLLTIGKIILGGFITGFIAAVGLGSNYAQTLNRLDQSEQKIVKIEIDRAERGRINGNDKRRACIKFGRAIAQSVEDVEVRRGRARECHLKLEPPRVLRPSPKCKCSERDRQKHKPIRERCHA